MMRAGSRRASHGIARGYLDNGYEGYGRRRRRSKSRTPILAVTAGAASVAVIAGAVVGAGHLFSARSAANAAAVPNPNCTLIVPANPLTAQGLATPYQLTATDPAAGPCNEANANQTAFVQGAVLDPATGQISVYNPLVIDAGTQAAVTPTVPTLPAGAVVGIWFGFNGTTLSFEGADQAGGTTATATATATAAPTAAATAAATPTAAATSTAVPTATAAAPSATAATPTAAATGSTATAAPTTAATPSAGASTATAAVQAFIRQNGHHHGQANATATPAATATTAPTSSPAGTATAAPTAAATSSAAAATGTVTAPTVTGTQPPAGDSPAASGTPDAILQGANCVAGENIAGTFSSFTQVGACNAVAFFQAANTAIQAGTLTVPNPGTAKDGQPCMTTRNFGVIDQDQSDNVTTLYLANGQGQTAQHTAANAAANPNDTLLANGSDNGLIDFHVDPALGCTPWSVTDLANPGNPATALPLDELQAAAFAGQSGGPAALVPLNDPMTLDNNGNQSTDKTNAYRSIVDQAQLPTGETPAEYCGDMESIQGVRLQQDVNLLIGQTSPLPAMADNLFTFLAMRLQQSFTNLNCQNFGLQNDVSTTVDGNGVVVAACFLQQVNAVTAGAGNPTAGMTVCPATAASATPTASASSTASVNPTASAAPTAAGATTPGATPAASGAASPSATQAVPPAPTATGTNGAGKPVGGNASVADRKHQHWWY